MGGFYPEVELFLYKSLLDSEISQEVQRPLPGQQKTQRTNLALLVATMLDVRSANRMDSAAGLPRDAERIDMRYQWIERVLKNPLMGAAVCLMADRFNGTADLIAWCQDRNWDDRFCG